VLLPCRDKLGVNKMDKKFPTKNAFEFANDLFETCNLTEIESLQSSLKKDVEKKADQLKSLVRFVQ